MPSWNHLCNKDSHNYYFRRAEADVTEFIQYFCLGMRDSFAAVWAQAGEASRRGMSDHSQFLRQLDPRQRQLLALHNPSRKNRLYQLGPRLEQLVVDSLPTVTDPAHLPFAPDFPSAA